ncbi:hypothetical protein [Vagococcus salmoninarum]|uniref:hypothetical protein n=1 Tax=Vagococcus salmoninarum TaxID=2739 RepID=UPI0028D8D63C|nr:hypothetical protein [Vagococcus salmoninarum]
MGIKIKLSPESDRTAVMAAANEKLKESHPELTGNFEEDRTSERIRQKIEAMIQQVVIGLIFITAIYQ